MGSYATGNPTAATHPASNCQTFIALNASHQTREVLQPWVFTFFFSFFKSYGFYFFFLISFFSLLLKLRFVYWHTALPMPFTLAVYLIRVLLQNTKDP